MIAVAIAIVIAMLMQSPVLGQQRKRPRPASTNPLGRSAEIIEGGRQLYNSSCTVCHGLDGTIGDRGPALAAARRYVRTSDDEIFAAIKNGISGTLMPPAGLAENDIWKIVAYIRSLRATASEEFVAGNAAQGGEVFQGKGGCAECHMIGGHGGLLGPDLSNVGAERSVRYLQDSLTTRRPAISRGFQPVHVITKAGQTIDGVVKNEDNFSMQVMDRSYRLHLLNRTELEQIDYGKEPLMPSDYGKTLSAEEMQNLLAFLSRQVRR